MSSFRSHSGPFEVAEVLSFLIIQFYNEHNPIIIERVFEMKIEEDADRTEVSVKFDHIKTLVFILSEGNFYVVH